MSWVEAFDLGGVDVSSPGVADYTRGAIIQWGVQNGLSHSAIQREISGLGIGFSAGQLLPMIREEEDRQGTALESTQIGVDYSTGTLLASTPPDNWNGQYVHKVTAIFRTSLGGNQYDLNPRTVSIKSSVPLTSFQAQNAAYDLWSTQTSGEDTPDAPDMSNALVTQLRGVWYDTDKPGRAGVAAGVS